MGIRKMISFCLLCTLLPTAAQVTMTHIEPGRLPDMNIPRFSHATFYVHPPEGDQHGTDGELTVVGGHTSGFVLTPTLEYFKDGEWHVLQTVYTHDDGLCVPLRSGKVLLAGGYEKNLGIGQTFEVEMYDPETHTFRGFGCLDKKRAHVSGIEIDSGKVVVTGNWYNVDGIELYDGSPWFTHVKETSQQRSMPYLLRTSDGDVMVVSGLWDNYGKPITSNVVDRLRGEPFRVPLLETWHPILLALAPRPDASLIGDPDKGIYAYLIPVQDSLGQVAIAEVRDTVFSLLPTASPIPMDSKWGRIGWYTPIVVDRRLQRGYMLGQGEGDDDRKYLLSVSYARTPAELSVYYTDPIPDFGGSIPLVMPDGNLVVTGGIGKDSTFFSPTASVWVFPVASPFTAMSEAEAGRLWPWLLLAALTVTALIAYLIINKRRKGAEAESGREAHDSGQQDHPTSTPDSALMQHITELMEKRRFYLRKDLKMSDIAVEFGIHQNEVSACINSHKGYSFNQFVNSYRIEHAKQLLHENPEMKMSQVAEESGFSTDKSFFRSFKVLTGTTPKEWVMQQTG